ncbi:MAG: four helix bundle protein [Bacteroidota bacterium]
MKSDRTAIESYTDLLVWQRAMDLVDEVYDLARCFPSDERFDLRSQVRRAAVSVPSNIAEGWGRSSKKDFVRFLYIARGSLYEVETQMRIAQRQGYIEVTALKRLVEHSHELSRMLLGLIRSVQKQASR